MKPGTFMNIIKSLSLFVVIGFVISLKAYSNSETTKLPRLSPRNSTLAKSRTSSPITSPVITLNPSKDKTAPSITPATPKPDNFISLAYPDSNFHIFAPNNNPTERLTDGIYSQGFNQNSLQTDSIWPYGSSSHEDPAYTLPENTMTFGAYTNGTPLSIYPSVNESDVRDPKHGNWLNY